jgi:hypothetical protein
MRDKSYSVGAQHVAQRLINAEEEFLNTLQGILPMSREEARNIFNKMKKQRLLKLHLGIGRYTVKHGGFLDPEVLERIAAQPA